MSGKINEKIDILLGKFEAFCKSGETFDIHKYKFFKLNFLNSATFCIPFRCFQALTLDVIGQCAFAFNVNCQNDPNDLFLLNVQKFFSLGDFRLSKILQLQGINFFDSFFILFITNCVYIL